MSVNVILLSQLYPHPPPSSSGRVGLGYLIVVPHTCCSSQCFLSMSVRLWQASCFSSFQKRSAYLEASPLFLSHLMTTQVFVICLDYKLRVGTKTLEWIFASADWVGLAWPGLAGWLVAQCSSVCDFVLLLLLFLIWYRYKPHQQLMAKWLGCKERRKQNKRIFN